MRRVLVFGALLAIALGPVLARAQTPRGLRRVPQHDGFWISFGAGGGWEDTDFELGNQGRGGSVYIRMGGTPDPHFLFGGEALVWFNSDLFGDEVSRTNVMAVTQLYPARSGGVFLKGGFGVATYAVGSDEVSGIGTTVGLGADVRLGRNFYVTPNVDYMVQYFENNTVGSLLFTLGLTWH